MLLVIFGAGASYDSNPANLPLPAHHPAPEGASSRRPPLANQLFDLRTEFASVLSDFPECHAIVSHLRKPDVHIEGELERLQDEARGYPEGWAQLAAVRWYLQKMLSGCDTAWYHECGGITNYLTLLDQIRRAGNRDDVLLVTMNYDRLLDWSIEDFTRNNLGTPHQFKKTSDYLEGTFPLVKLHGSVHWGQRISKPEILDYGGNGVAATIRSAASIELSEQFVVCESDRKGVLVCWEDGKRLFPALAIPLITKSEFVCPKEHLGFLEVRLRRVTRVLTVGWRGMDWHFVNLLKQIPPAAPWWAVAGSHQSSEESLKNLTRAGVGIRDFHAYDGGFSKFVTDTQTNREILKPPKARITVTPLHAGKL
jgi:hypothetical protein